MLNLRSMRRENLPVGKILVDDVRDAQGAVLVDAGVILDEAMITLLPGVVYVAERDNTPTADEAADQLCRRQGRATPVVNQRRHPRQRWGSIITVTIEQSCSQSMTCREERVRTHDISRNGFSFIYRQYVPKGAKVSAEFDMLPGQPVFTATVRSCYLIGGRDHCVGVEFDWIRRAND